MPQLSIYGYIVPCEGGILIFTLECFIRALAHSLQEVCLLDLVASVLSQRLGQRISCGSGAQGTL